MTSDPRVIWLQECDANRAALVGGKATGLGSLLREGFQVPPGFAVSTRAYREHVEHNHLAGEIDTLLRSCHHNDPREAHERAAAEIRVLFENSGASGELEEEVLAGYDQLCRYSDSGSVTPVAVRSSATAEDMADASFAGQQETYLWILGGQHVLEHVKRCWASLFTPQAIAYRTRLDMPLADLAMGVVVQRMVPAVTAGVMLTIDPVNGDRSAIVIEASYGLGAAVVNGEVIPDRFCVDKVMLDIRSRAIGSKAVAYRFDPTAEGTRLEPVPAVQQTQPSLSDDEVVCLAGLGKRMERAAGGAQDIEWAIGPAHTSGREVFLLQARPETVWSQRDRPPLAGAGLTVMDRILQTMRVPATGPDR